MSREVSVIFTVNGGEHEVDRTVGEKVKQAIAAGAEHIELDGTFMRASAVMEIRNVTRPDYAWGEIPESRRLAAEKATPATQESPGYRKFMAAREKLLRRWTA